MRQTYLGLEEFQYIGSKTIDLAIAVLHKTIKTPQQYFQREESPLRTAMVDSGSKSLAKTSPTPPCDSPYLVSGGGWTLATPPTRQIDQKQTNTKTSDEALGENCKQRY